MKGSIPFDPLWYEANNPLIDHIIQLNDAVRKFYVVRDVRDSIKVLRCTCADESLVLGRTIDNRWSIWWRWLTLKCIFSILLLNELGRLIVDMWSFQTVTRRLQHHRYETVLLVHNWLTNHWLKIMHGPDISGTKSLWAGLYFRGALHILDTSLWNRDAIWTRWTRTPAALPGYSVNSCRLYHPGAVD